ASFRSKAGRAKRFAQIAHVFLHFRNAFFRKVCHTLCACYNANFNGEFGTCFAKRLARGSLRRTVDFKDDASRAHVHHVSSAIALPASNAYFRRLLGEWSVREDAPPNLSALAACA